MAYSSVSHGIQLGLVNRVSDFLAAIRDSRQRYKMYRQTISELSSLSDRELNDLGLNRSSITAIAAEAAYGK